MQLTIFDLEARTWKEPRAAEPKEEVREVKEKVQEPKCFEDYIGRCEYCEFENLKFGCVFRDSKYNPCENGSHWKPNGCKIPGLCGNCKYGNLFEYDGEANHPIEEPNIYCEHEDGSLNRYSPYERFKTERFGLGTWHRQHEYDTCERWEKE